MASMTDVIFLLLIFFMITSTMVSPNSLKVLLPEGSQKSTAKPLTRVIVDKELRYYVAFGQEPETEIEYSQLMDYLQQTAATDTTRYVALYADESVPYREIIRVLNVANENRYKMVLATRPPEGE